MHPLRAIVEPLESRALMDGTLPSATALGAVTASGRTVSGSVGNGDINDYYRFKLDAAATLTAVSTATGGRADIRIIKDANGNHIADPGETRAFSSTGVTGAATLSIGLGSGTYYLRVSRATGAPHYSVKLKAAPTAPAADPLADFLRVATRAVTVPLPKIYLKVDGVSGPVTDSAHKAESDVLTYSFGVSTPAGSSKPTFQDFVITKPTDSASLPLLGAAFSRQHFRTVKITLARNIGGGYKDFFSYTLSDVTVSSMHTGGSSGVTSTEDVSFHYAKIQLEYRAYDSAGNLTGIMNTGWDVALNKKI